MITLITGGSKCGKSALAEKITCGFSGKKFYIATMKPYGEEAFSAIARHREMRCGKGFETVEKFTDVGGLALPEKSAVLLECVGNLCANEMFTENGIFDPVENVVSGIKRLCETAECVTIVTSEVGNDGFSYERETEKYISHMGEINRRIAEFADNVIECVYGIPIIIKGVLPC